MIVKIESVNNHYIEHFTDDDHLDVKLEYSEVTATLISKRVRITVNVIVYPEDMVINNGTPHMEKTISKLMKYTLYELGA